MLQPSFRRKFIVVALAAYCISSCSESTLTETNVSVLESGQTDVDQIEARDLDPRPNILVVVTDDQGYADLGAQGIFGDISTPHIDQLAADGARMTSGYVTAPQCIPSRAGLLTGKYQQSFGLDDNRFAPLPLDEPTMADRLKDAGYQTGMVGKWHLEINQSSQGFDFDNLSIDEKATYFPDQRGFDDVYFGYRNIWWTNYDLQGNSLPAGYRENTDYRLDVTTDAGISFIDKHQDKPFFLYLSYFAPHVPLESTEAQLAKFSGVPETRRQHALAMLGSIDDGIGRIRSKLEESSITDNTLIYFVSDNGAPLGIHKLDLPIENNGGAWDGSLNDPMIGEKGMLSDGGIRVPYIVTWPGTIPAGIIVDAPVSTLDIATTSLAVAGVESLSELDGENLLPSLVGDAMLEERTLYWRFWSQAAIRQGQWKYLQVSTEYELLFDMNSSTPESENVIASYPEIAGELREKLTSWTDGLYRPGLTDPDMNSQEIDWYAHYF